MATVTLNSVVYGNAPVGLQIFTFEYKLWNDPDSSYVLISNSAAVNTDSTLAAPLPITGLTSGQLYYVRGSANCDSPRKYFIQPIQL